MQGRPVCLEANLQWRNIQLPGQISDGLTMDIELII
jgi:hypothetical protein